MTWGEAPGEGEPLRYKEAWGTGTFSSGWYFNHASLSTLTLPFQSYLEAEMARLAMDADDECHWQVVEKEVTVNRPILAVWVLEWAKMGMVASAQVLSANLSLRGAP